MPSSVLEAEAAPSEPDRSDPQRSVVEPAALSGRFVAATVLPPIAVVVAVLAGALVLNGAPVLDTVRFGGYWLGFVALPGMALLASVAPRKGLLFIGAVGAATGYVLELGVWIAASAVDARLVMWLYPPLVLLATVPILIRHWRAGEFGHGPGRTMARRILIWRPWALAGAVLAVVAVPIVRFWITQELPMDGDVSWSVDMFNHLGWAADATRSVPPTNPSIAGLEMQYHWFMYGHFANVHQVTGIELPLVLGRFFLVPMLALLPLLLAAAVRQLTTRPWAGPLAGLLGTVAGELDVTADPASVSMAAFARYVGYSPSYLYSLVLFSGLLALLLAQCLATCRDRFWRWSWLPFAVLAAGSVGVKATILPTVLGGVLIAAAWQFFTRRELPVRRRVDAALWISSAIMAVCALAGQLLLYGGSKTSRLVIEPHVGLDQAALTIVFDWLIDPLRERPGHSAVALLIGVPVTLFVLLAPYAGALSLWRHRRHATWIVLLLGIFTAGLLAASTFREPAGSQHWFLVQTLPALAILGGWGLARVLAWLAAQGLLRRALLFGTVAAALVFVSAAAASPAFTTAQAGRVISRYALFAIAGIGVYLVLRRVFRSRRGVANALMIAIVVGACFADGALSNVVFVKSWLSGGPIYRDDGFRRHRPDTTPELRAALDWVKENTPTNAVIAVNNHCLSQDSYRDKKTDRLKVVCFDRRVFYYSALSERRVYVESWTYTDQAYEAAMTSHEEPFAMGTVFPKLTERNDEVFRAPTPELLARLYDDGVRYLVADTRPDFDGDKPNHPSPQLAELTEVVFSNSDAVVYRVPKPTRET